MLRSFNKNDTFNKKNCPTKQRQGNKKKKDKCLENIGY